MQNAQIAVHLLKTASKPTDRYEEVLSSVENGKYAPNFLPVLEHGLLDKSLADIKSLVADGAFSGTKSQAPQYGGIIFTSQRAVEAFSVALRSMSNNDTGKQMFNQRTVMYVVGPATLTALQAVKQPCPIRGEHTGSGENLAAFILEDFDSTWAGCGRPALLFLVGDKRRDIIPKTLQHISLPSNKQIRVDEITVYQTIENPKFFENFLQEYTAHGNTKQWIVVFSPSGCETMLRALGFLDPNSSKFNQSHHANVKVATIGPTTRDYLISEFGFEPQASASKPTPGGLYAAIKENDWA